MFHCSPVNIESARTDGLLGAYVCFSCDPYAIGGAEFVYELDDDSVEVIRASSLFYDQDRCETLAQHVRDAAEYFDVSEEQAMGLLDESISVRDVCENADADLSWAQQRWTAQCAEILGIDGIAGRDEQGTVYFMDLRRVLSKMKLVEST